LANYCRAGIKSLRGTGAIGTDRVVVPARQATYAAEFASLESILGLLQSLNIRALLSFPEMNPNSTQNVKNLLDSNDDIAGTSSSPVAEIKSRLLRDFHLAKKY
jgi:hypothetical protein